MQILCARFAPPASSEAHSRAAWQEIEALLRTRADLTHCSLYRFQQVAAEPLWSVALVSTKPLPAALATLITTTLHAHQGQTYALPDALARQLLDRTQQQQARRVPFFALHHGSAGPALPTVLAHCPCCTHTWLQQGSPATQCSLSEDEVTSWAARLQVPRTQFPVFVCHLCQRQYLGGALHIDVYEGPAGASSCGGYGFTWEAVQPAHHLQVAVLREAILTQTTTPRISSAPRLTDPPQVLAVLAWLAQSEAHDLAAQSVPPEMLTILAQDQPPGAQAPGTDEWRWQAATWQADCAPLGGPVIVLLSQAGPPQARFHLPTALGLCQELLERISRFPLPEREA